MCLKMSTARAKLLIKISAENSVPKVSKSVRISQSQS